MLKEKRNEMSAFALIQEQFALETETLEKDTEHALEQLEYAFDFMEAAFGESQEMVVFITELSVNADAVRFLQENECPRYYRYNKSLLFEDQQAAIRRQLDEIRGGMRS